jgi:hypothetical protein
VNCEVLGGRRIPRGEDPLYLGGVAPDTAAVDSSELIAAEDLVVALDYGTFNLYTSEAGLENDLEGLVVADGGVGLAEGVVCVTSPHQNNFEMALRVEMWSGEPPSDLDDWEEAFEVHLEVGDFGLLYGSPTMDFVPLPVRPGSYHALITGRGFVAIGWPGSTEPGDSWRIRMWPSAGPARPARLREYTEPPIVHPDPQFREEGVAAVRRIHRDLDEERQLTGERGTATAERRMPGARRKLYKYFRDPSGWLTEGGGGGQDMYALHAWDYTREGFGDANRIVPCNGDVECHLLDAKSPAYSVASWTWLRRTPDRITPERRDGRPGAILVPATPQMTLRFDLENAADDDGTPTTTVRVTHDHVPIEWVDDLSAYWRWMLERADYEFDLGDARRSGYTR